MVAAGDVVHARGTSVDDVVRERYWILRDYAKRRHLKLNVGRGGIEIGVRVQKGPKHPRATARRRRSSRCRTGRTSRGGTRREGATMR